MVPGLSYPGLIGAWVVFLWLICVRLEILSELRAGTGQPGLGKTFGLAEQPRNLLVVEALYVMQPDNCAVVPAEPRQGRIEIHR